MGIGEWEMGIGAPRVYRKALRLNASNLPARFVQTLISVSSGKMQSWKMFSALTYWSQPPVGPFPVFKLSCLG